MAFSIPCCTRCRKKQNKAARLKNGSHLCAKAVVRSYQKHSPYTAKLLERNCVSSSASWFQSFPEEEIVKLITMKLGISVFAIAGLLTASAYAQNSTGEPGDVRSDTHDIRQDRRDVR